MYLYLVFNKSAYRSLLYIDIILFVKTIFDFEQFFYTDIRRMKPDIQYSPKLNIKNYIIHLYFLSINQEKVQYIY